MDSVHAAPDGSDLSDSDDDPMTFTRRSMEWRDSNQECWKTSEYIDRGTDKGENVGSKWDSGNQAQQEQAGVDQSASRREEMTERRKKWVLETHERMSKRECSDHTKHYLSVWKKDKGSVDRVATKMPSKV